MSNNILEKVEKENLNFDDLTEEQKEEFRKAKIEESKNLKQEEKDVQKGIYELWKDEHGNPYATIISDGHLENWAINSRHFRNFITKKIYEKEKSVPNGQTIKTLQDIFSARAQFSGKQYQTHLRCAQIEGIIYIDLCRDDWKVVKINKEKIEVIEPEDENIKFKRYNHMRELKYDSNAKEEDLNLIYEYVNIENEEDKLLFKTDSVLLPVANIPRAIDIIYGSAGSAKSFSMKIKRKVIDPSSMDSLSFSKNLTEMIQKVSHHYIPNFDNVRRISNELSDFFCRIVTGDAYSKRELYTDDEDIIYKIKRKVMLNGINVAGEEPDFLDRAVTYEMARIPKSERKKEEVLWAEFEKDQPKITGAIFKILQKTLKEVEKVKLKELPRMADYCHWGEAVARVLGESEGVFTLTYFQKIGNLSKEALEANPVGLCLLEFMKENEEFEGTATELLEKLESIAEKMKINNKYFPSSPNHLSRKINEIKSNLEEEGYVFEKDKDSKSRILKLSKKKDRHDRLSSSKQELSPKEPKFEGFSHDDKHDDKSKNDKVTVIDDDSMTIKTINDDNISNDRHKQFTDDKDDKKEGNDDKDDKIQKVLRNFTEEGIKEAGWTKEKLQESLK